MNAHLYLAVAAAMVISLVLYTLLAGADFGGGIWYLFARGDRGPAQRELIREAIAPVWEANHVWLILLVVLLFTGFPEGFAIITTRLHIPLTLLLVGIICRGSAFTFRHYDLSEKSHALWERFFSVSSVLTPLFLGASLGAISTGALDVSFNLDRADFYRVYVAPWFAPAPILVGLFTFALFAFLAAIYLTNETLETELQNDFRKRAIGAGVVVGILALAAALVLRRDAEIFHAKFTRSPWFWPVQLAAGTAAVSTFVALLRRKFSVARIAGIVQVSCIILGWATAQFPYLVVSNLTLRNAAAPPRTQALLLIALAAGLTVLGPSLWLLIRVFKKRPGQS